MKIFPLRILGACVAFISIDTCAVAGFVKVSDASFSWTKDTSTGIEWLDFDGGPAPTTINRPYYEVKAELSAGGDYSGWRFATRAEIYQFILNITGFPYLVPAPGGEWERNSGATGLVAAWTGYTSRTALSDDVIGFTGEELLFGGDEAVYYSGLLDDLRHSPVYTAWIPSGIVARDRIYTGIGSWLVRGGSGGSIVPEPSMILGWFTGTTCAMFIFGRYRRVQQSALS